MLIVIESILMVDAMLLSDAGQESLAGLYSLLVVGLRAFIWWLR